MMPMVSEGCSACEGTGTKGRVLLFEYLIKDKDHSLQKMSSLRDAALNALEKGEINASDALCAP